MVVTVETTSERSETESIVRRTRSKGWSCKTRHRKIRNSGRSRFFFVMNARIHISHCAPIVPSPSVSPFSTILRLFSLFLSLCSSLLRWSALFGSTLRFRFDFRACIEMGKFLANVTQSYRWKFPRLAISVQFTSRLAMCRIPVGRNSIETILTLARLSDTEDFFGK